MARVGGVGCAGRFVVRARLLGVWASKGAGDTTAMATSTTTASQATQALQALDRAAFLALFAPQGTYVDPCRPGLSQGRDAVAGHLGLLWEGLAGTTVTVLETVEDGPTVALRWMAQLPAERGGHALDAVTWLNLDAHGAVVAGRSFFDAALFLGPGPRTPEEQAVERAALAGIGAPVILEGRDSRGMRFDLAHMGGRVACLLCAGRAVQMEAFRVADVLGDAFGGDVRVVLVVLLDASDVPGPLRGVARTALMSVRAQAVRRFKQGFTQRGVPVPAGVEEMVWFLLDEDGSRLAGLGVERPLKAPLLAVVDGQGRLLGRHTGTAAQVAPAAIAQVKGALLDLPAP